MLIIASYTGVTRTILSASGHWTYLHLIVLSRSKLRHLLLDLKTLKQNIFALKKTSKGIVMGWYFFSQIWFYFYKIVIEIFDYQMWISDCLFILFEMMCVLHSLLICWCSPDINFSFIKFTFEITILCWLFNFVKSISIFLVHLIHNKRILNIHLKTLKRNCCCCFL